MHVIIKPYDERGETVTQRSGIMKTLEVVIGHMIALKKDYPNVVGYKLDIRWDHEGQQTRDWGQRMALSVQRWLDQFVPRS